MRSFQSLIEAMFMETPTNYPLEPGPVRRAHYPDMQAAFTALDEQVTAFESQRRH
jgi:hypothetical protein